MVDRGHCHFAVKVKNIQEQGGALAIIVDDKLGENPELLVMKDDG